jgi:starch synthase
MTIRVLSVASEAVPLVKTGGLADVAGALPAAVAPHGVEMTTFLPGYPAVMKALSRPRALHTWDNLLGEKARLVGGKIDGQPLLALDAPAFFQRDGNPYVDSSGRDWADNWRRFAAFGRAAADVGGGMVKGRAFDLVHAHDWQAAMALAYLRFSPPDGGKRVPSVMTIHNMAFQGHYGADVFPALGLPPHAWAMDGVEYHGGVGFLKAGLEAASMITTVPDLCARDPHRPIWHGIGRTYRQSSSSGDGHRQRHRHRAMESGNRYPTPAGIWATLEGKRATLPGQTGSQQART